jgi:hypothetical protein
MSLGVHQQSIRPISYTRTFDRANTFRPISLYTHNSDSLPSKTPLLALLDPVLHSLAHTLNLLFRHSQTHLAVRLASLYKVPDALSHAQVVVPHHGVLLLPAPDEIADVLGRAGNDVVCSGHAGDNRSDEADEDVPVARDDRAGHGSHQDVNSAREQLLVALFGRRERADCGCDVVFGVEGAGHAVVNRLLGGCGVVVEEQARAGDLGGQAVCRCGRAGERIGQVLFVLRLVGLAGSGWRSGGCDLTDRRVGGCVVDGLAPALKEVLESGRGGGLALEPYHGSQRV